MSRISVPRKGDHCPVRFDPADHSRILPIGDFGGPSEKFGPGNYS